MCLVVLLSRSTVSSFPLSPFLLISSITPYYIITFTVTPHHSTNRFSSTLYRKIFEAFDGETIAAMDPESFAEYLGSQSLLDMMASAGAGADAGGGAGGGAGAGAGEEGVGDREGAEEVCRDRSWNKDTDTTHTPYYVST